MFNVLEYQLEKATLVEQEYATARDEFRAQMDPQREFKENPEGAVAPSGLQRVQPETQAAGTEARPFVGLSAPLGGI